MSFSLPAKVLKFGLVGSSNQGLSQSLGVRGELIGDPVSPEAQGIHRGRLEFEKTTQCLLHPCYYKLLEATFVAAADDLII